MLSTLRGHSDLNVFKFPGCGLYRVARRFGGVLPPGRGGPPERPVGKLVDVPAGVLLEPVVVPTFRAAVAQARPSACFVGGVMFEITPLGWPAAARPGTGRVPDLSQVP